MSRIVLLLLCLAALSLVCSASNSKRRSKSGSKKNKGKKKNKASYRDEGNDYSSGGGVNKNNGDGSTVHKQSPFLDGTNLPPGDSQSGKLNDFITTKDPFSSDFMKKRLDDSRSRGLASGSRGLASAANTDVYKTTRLSLNLGVDVKEVEGVMRSFRVRGVVDIHYVKVDKEAEEAFILDSWGLFLIRFIVVIIIVKLRYVSEMCRFHK